MTGFRKRYFKHRVLVLLVLLLGAATVRGVVRHGENRPVDWSRAERIVVCPLVAPRADWGALSQQVSVAPAALESWAGVQHQYWTGSAGRPFAVEFAPPAAADPGPPFLPQPGDGFVARWKQVTRFLRYFAEADASFPPQRKGDVRVWLYVYADEDRGAWEDRESVGTRRGRRGVVFSSDDPARWGNTLCVLMHESLHAVGARDHRNRDETIAYPEGYADPSASPRLPQKQAEVMALGIPYTETDEERVDALDEVVMGLWTAREIGWK